MARGVKMERGSNRRERAVAASTSTAPAPPPPPTPGEPEEDDVVSRRLLRRKYHAVQNKITEQKDEICKPDSGKFMVILGEVQTLHEQVQKSREQVSDAEALLDLVNNLLSYMKSLKNDEVTPSDFVSTLLTDFGEQNGASSTQDDRKLIQWKELGLAVSHIFKNGAGCSTMLGPMSVEMKKRKVAVRTKRVNVGQTTRPEELNDTEEEKTDTDKNMIAMYGILKTNRRVRLERLVLNRQSFAQTVENLFALSFLVKDGRVEITVDKAGRHLLTPRNYPGGALESGEISFGHFVFRFDFKDWQHMKDAIVAGEELMPHRDPVVSSCVRDTEQVNAHKKSHYRAPTTPIRKLSRNRGLVQQEQMVVEDSPESERNYTNSRGAALLKGKRKFI